MNVSEINSIFAESFLDEEKDDDLKSLIAKDEELMYQMKKLNDYLKQNGRNVVNYNLNFNAFFAFTSFWDVYSFFVLSSGNVVSVISSSKIIKLKKGCYPAFREM